MLAAFSREFTTFRKAIGRCGARSLVEAFSAFADSARRQPKESLMAPSLGGLVDAENGLVSRRIFIEREIYAREIERIFARCWLEFLDPERSRHLPRGDDDRHVQPLDGQLNAPGAYFVSCIAKAAQVDFSGRKLTAARAKRSLNRDRQEAGGLRW
jgi:hypothetical protein